MNDWVFSLNNQNHMAHLWYMIVDRCFYSITYRVLAYFDDTLLSLWIFSSFTFSLKLVNEIELKVKAYRLMAGLVVGRMVVNLIMCCWRAFSVLGNFLLFISLSLSDILSLRGLLCRLFVLLRELNERRERKRLLLFAKVWQFNGIAFHSTPNTIKGAVHTSCLQNKAYTFWTWH